MATLGGVVAGRGAPATAEAALALSVMIHVFVGTAFNTSSLLTLATPWPRALLAQSIAEAIEAHWELGEFLSVEQYLRDAAFIVAKVATQLCVWCADATQHAPLYAFADGGPLVGEAGQQPATSRAKVQEGAPLYSAVLAASQQIKQGLSNQHQAVVGQCLGDHCCRRVSRPLHHVTNTFFTSVACAIIKAHAVFVPRQTKPMSVCTWFWERDGKDKP
jgi:hypothetical protein